MRLLEGNVEPFDDAPGRIADLEDEIRELQSALSTANATAAQAKRDAARALTNLRRQLSPLYRALQDVFGELDAAGAADTAQGVTTNTGRDARTTAIWESWKGRLGPTCAKVIDALLLQADMTNRQIAIAIGTNRIQTIYDAVRKMNQASLLVKNGDRYSLKQL